MGRCWKCGKEVNGLRAMSWLPVCPECEQLEVMQKIADGQHKKTIAPAAHYDCLHLPKWIEDSFRDDQHVIAGFLALFFGVFGAHFIYSDTKRRIGFTILTLELCSFGILGIFFFPLGIFYTFKYFCMDNADYLRENKPRILERNRKARRYYKEWTTHDIQLPLVEPES